MPQWLWWYRLMYQVPFVGIIDRRIFMHFMIFLSIFVIDIFNILATIKSQSSHGIILERPGLTTLVITVHIYASIVKNLNNFLSSFLFYTMNACIYHWLDMSEEKQEVKKKVKRDEFGDVEEEKTEVKKESD